MKVKLGSKKTLATALKCVQCPMCEKGSYGKMTLMTGQYLGFS